MNYSTIESQLRQIKDGREDDCVIELRGRLMSYLNRKAVHLQRIIPGRLIRLPQAVAEHFELAVDVAALAFDYARFCHFVFCDDFLEANLQAAERPDSVFPHPRLFADLVSSPLSASSRTRLLHALVTVVIARHMEFWGNPRWRQPSSERGPSFLQSCIVICETLAQQLEDIKYSPHSQVDITPAVMLDSFDATTSEFKRLSAVDILRPTYNRMVMVNHCEFRLPSNRQFMAEPSDLTWFDSLFDEAVHAAKSCAHSLVGKSYQEQVAVLKSGSLKGFATLEHVSELLRSVEAKLLRPVYVAVFLQVCWFKAQRLSLGSAAPQPGAVASSAGGSNGQIMSESAFYSQYAEAQPNAVRSCLKLALKHVLQHSAFLPSNQPLQLAALGVAAYLLEFATTGVPESMMQLHHFSSFDARLAYGDRVHMMRGLWQAIINNAAIREVDDELANLQAVPAAPGHQLRNLQDAFSFVNSEQTEAHFVCTICTDLIYFGTGAQFHLIDNCSSASASRADDKLACGRLFCKPCIQEWIASQGSAASCPVCSFQTLGAFVHRGQVRQASLCDAPPYVYSKLKQLVMTCNSCDLPCQAADIDKHVCLPQQQQVIMLD